MSSAILALLFALAYLQVPSCVSWTNPFEDVKNCEVEAITKCKNNYEAQLARDDDHCKRFQILKNMASDLQTSVGECQTSWVRPFLLKTSGYWMGFLAEMEDGLCKGRWEDALIKIFQDLKILTGDDLSDVNIGDVSVQCIIDAHKECVGQITSNPFNICSSVNKLSVCYKHKYEEGCNHKPLQVFSDVLFKVQTVMDLVVKGYDSPSISFICQ